MHPLLSNSQESINAHRPSKYTMFPMLYIVLDNSIRRFHTFPNSENYHKFAFPVNSETIPPYDIRNEVNCLLLSYLHFHPIII
jgi:hypothetical protein